MKAGLITADELVLAGESTYVEGDSYLNIGTNGSWYWSMTPADFFDGRASVWYEDVGLCDVNVAYHRGAVRPVINVTTNNGFTSGSGTVSDPYTLS